MITWKLSDIQDIPKQGGRRKTAYGSKWRYYND